MKKVTVKECLRKRKHVDSSGIKSDVKSFLDNRKNVNNLLNVIFALDSEEEVLVVAAVRGLFKVFSLVIQNGEMTSSRPLTSLTQQELTADEKYNLWLQETYRDFVSKLLELMHHQSQTVQELALCSLMKLVQSEGQHPILRNTKQQCNFPVGFYQKILASLLSSDVVMTSLLARAKEFMDYDDVRCNTMTFITEALRKQSDPAPEIFIKNTFALLQVLSMPDDTDDRQPSLFVTSSGQGQSSVKDVKGQRKQFGNVWITFLQNKLSMQMYKKVLVILHDKVMPHMNNPLVLCDFLTQAYNVGGAISLLALNGLFVLIQEHHLNYPDFYTKLYALMDENVLHVKYRARFFYLADLFLTSTHLPVYLVAAFIKRLSRLSLTAPTDSLIFLLPFIYNLIIRHPHTQTLVHRAQPEDLECDPYKEEQTDPAKCCALDSSLWEIKSLQMHYHPDVANFARKINKNLPDTEYDLSEKLDTKYDELFNNEFEKSIDKVHTTFHPVSGLFTSKDDPCSQFWELE